MKLPFNKFFPQDTKGFTLIELLVVIGILGILASALVATIDPFEQLKKGNDAAVQNATAEFVNANVRYYTSQNKMPWGVNGGTSCMGNSGATTLTGATLNDMTQCLEDIISLGELKTGFTTATGILSKILISGAGDSTSGADAGITACFLPESKSMQANKNTQFASNGTVQSAGCKSFTGSSQTGTNCYWCAL